MGYMETIVYSSKSLLRTGVLKITGFVIIDSMNLPTGTWSSTALVDRWIVFLFSSVPFDCFIWEQLQHDFNLYSDSYVYIYIRLLIWDCSDAVEWQCSQDPVRWWTDSLWTLRCVIFPTLQSTSLNQLWNSLWRLTLGDCCDWKSPVF